MEIKSILCLVFEKLVDVFHGCDAIIFFGHGREVEVGHFATEQSAVQRPFGQRDVEEQTFAGSRVNGAFGAVASDEFGYQKTARRGNGGVFHKIATMHREIR